MDFDRPLSPRGLKEAAAIGEHLRASGATEAASLVLCSAARRTVETLNQLIPHLPPTVTISQERALYGASRSELLSLISEVDSGEAAVLVIAHNPGIGGLAAELVSRADTALADRVSTRFPPGALTVFDFEMAAWEDLRTARVCLIEFVTPQIPA
jgi:phosphohistidine phosphatase